MNRTFPVGWFERGLLGWGAELNAGTCLAAGTRVEVPDLRSADPATVLELRAQHLRLLGTLGEGTALQLQWTVEDDFAGPLAAYGERGRDAAPWCRRTRAVRRAFYEQRRAEGSLRRERVYLYLGRRCTGLRREDVRSVAACEAYLSQEAAGFAAQLRALEGTCPLARWQRLEDRGHLVHLRQFLNPSLGSRPEAAGDPFGAFDPSRSVRSNCLRGDLEAFSLGGAAPAGAGLYFDGHYHALMVMRELPRGTRPDMLIPVLDAVGRGVAITLNIQPRSVEREIDRLRREIDELRAFLSDRKAVGVENDLQLRRERIDSLLSSVTIPFSLLMVVRVWDATVEGLAAKSLAVRAALQRIDGAEFMQVNHRVQARQLFYETLPGHLGSGYRGWDIYVENHNLADLMPISSTFTGQLDESQALYDSPGGGVVGLRLVTAGGTPQHSIVVGVNGAGKSAFLMDLMSQSDCDWSYRFFQEEGMAFVTQAQLCGMQSLVLRESGDQTLNPFDTFGLPLTSATVAGVVKTCMKLVGRSRDEDRNQRREGLIGEYVHSHCADCAEDWKQADEERWHRLARRALAAERLRQGDDDFLDGYLNLREREAADAGRCAEELAALPEEAIVAYAAHPVGRHQVAAMVFTELPPGEYPQFGGLVSLLRHGRKAHHRSARVAEELDLLSSELAKGRRVGGIIGAFLDGPTNVELRGAGLHFDTSRLPDGTLKEVAGFTVFDRVRHYLLTLPRRQSKVMLLDELRRILLIPGATEFIKELLAQMRKYRCVFVGAFQEPSQIDDIDPALTDLLLGQCKQYFLMRQNHADQVRRLARAIGLPPVAQRAVAQHPLIEHQTAEPRAAYLTYFSREQGAPTCGTVRVEVDPFMRYVAESSGEVFDDRRRALLPYPSVYDGVMAEVGRRARRAAAGLAAGLGLVAALGLSGGCRSETATAGYRDGVDAGYVLGSADAVKRLYWARQALEDPAASAAPAFPPAPPASPVP
jgi:hypothetical protein